MLREKVFYLKISFFSFFRMVLMAGTMAAACMFFVSCGNLFENDVAPENQNLIGAGDAEPEPVLISGLLILLCSHLSLY